jgi:hypothetical protein
MTAVPNPEAMDPTGRTAASGPEPTGGTAIGGTSFPPQGTSADLVHFAPGST